MKKYDVIVVGLGPAGVVASKILKENNVNFCVIDKNKFPREKLCGGGLTNKSVKLLKKLDVNIDSKRSYHCNNVLVSSKGISKNVILDNDIIMIDRKEFDYNNVKEIIKEKYLKEKITNLKDNILTTDKDNYEFKYLIFADGVNGYSRNLINNREFGYCVECRVDEISEQTVLDFEAIIGGYGWVFPKVDHTTIGLGGFDNRKNNYQDLLCAFAKKYNFRIDRKDIRGYPIPVFTKEVYDKSVIDNKYILIGDAASLVDPVSGEGIYYAMLSGKLASESIIECLKDNKNIKDVYFDKTKALCNSLVKRRKASKLLYSSLGYRLIKHGLRSKRVLNKIKRIFG